MKFTVILTLVAAAASFTNAAPFIQNTQGRIIKNNYIVMLKDNATLSTFSTGLQDMVTKHNALAGTQSNKIRQTYEMLGGFSTTLSKACLKEVMAMDEVEYVEQDAILTIQVTQTKPPSWGLTRVSERNLNTAAPYLYKAQAGAGVTAYVIDTGINTAHVEFQGRATMGASFIQGATTDDNGHGSHVSGTIGGATYGVAKKVKLVGVKVLDSKGSGATSGVVGGMDWVAKKAKGTKAVVNMSLGGGKSQAIDDAAVRLNKANIPLIVAAGNDGNADACAGSPSGAPNTFTVAASDRTDTIAAFSSFGKCVEIIAPGVDITSAWIGSTTAKNTISGTSMATPHVVGVAAYYMSLQNTTMTAAQVFAKLSSTATPNKIKGSLKGTPNKLVFNGAA